MGSEENNKIESEATPAIPQEASADKQIHTDDSPPEKSLATVEKDSEYPAPEKKPGNSNDRDAALTRVVTEKRLALIKAWEENEKTKKENKAHKKLSEILAWENTKKASVEAELKQIEELFEKKKAEYAERMKNKMAEIHKAAEEKRALVVAKRGEDCIKVEETAAKFRSTGETPKRAFGCFGC